MCKMLIGSKEITDVLNEHNITITGAFHIGAHDCEELGFYSDLGVMPEDVIWIDAIEHKVLEAMERGIPNVYKAVITDKDDEDIMFNISNNIQSSSVLEFGTHSQEHPGVVFIGQLEAKTVTVDTFFERNKLNCEKCNFWNFDIQGAELMALRGAIKSIKHAEVIYLEVNERELYKGCCLIEEIDVFLSYYNFKRVLTNMTINGWGDALYVLEKI